MDEHLAAAGVNLDIQCVGNALQVTVVFAKKLHGRIPVGKGHLHRCLVVGVAHGLI